MGVRRVLLAIVLWTAVCAVPGIAGAESFASRWDRDFRNAIHDPNAPLRQLQLEFDRNRALQSGGENTTGLSVNPTWPVPALGIVPRSVVNLSLPVAFVPRGGLGDLEVYDTFVLDVAGFGSLGMGPALIAPSATEDALGQGKWQLGIAPVLSVTAWPQWTIGFTARDYASVGGEASRPAVSQLLVEPALTRTFSNGWFAGHSDFDWQVDWHHDEVTLPIGIQVGRAFDLAGYALSLSVEAAFVPVRPQGSDPWQGALELTLFYRGVVE